MHGFISAFNCYFENKDFGGPNMNNAAVDKTDTVQDCQRLCQQTSGCVKFTYLTDSSDISPEWRKSCVLKDDPLGGLIDKENAVSGPKECPYSKNLINQDPNFLAQDEDVEGKIFCS